MVNHIETQTVGPEEPDSTKMRHSSAPQDMINALLAMVKKVTNGPKIEGGVMSPDHPGHDAFFANNVAKLPQSQFEQLERETH